MSKCEEKKAAFEHRFCTFAHNFYINALSFKWHYNWKVQQKVWTWQMKLGAGFWSVFRTARFDIHFFKKRGFFSRFRIDLFNNLHLFLCLWIYPCTSLSPSFCKTKKIGLLLSWRQAASLRRKTWSKTTFIVDTKNLNRQGENLALMMQKNCRIFY